MNNLSSFLKENAEVVKNQKVVISERFKDEKGKPVCFEIRPLMEKEVERIRKSCTKRIKTKKGTKDETDYEILGAKMVVESMVFPPLKSEELQKSYNVFGAEELIQTMLTAGEYTNLVSKVQEVSGYDLEIEDLVEEAKN